MLSSLLLQLTAAVLDLTNFNGKQGTVQQLVSGSRLTRLFFHVDLFNMHGAFITELSDQLIAQPN